MRAMPACRHGIPHEALDGRARCCVSGAGGRATVILVLGGFLVAA